MNSFHNNMNNVEVDMINLIIRVKKVYLYIDFYFLTARKILPKRKSKNGASQIRKRSVKSYLYEQFDCFLTLFRKDTRTESLVTLDFMLESKTEESH